MPSARNSGPVPSSNGLDADAPYLVESYQHGTGRGTQDQLPTYTYSSDPASSRPAGQPRSWDEAARAKANPIQPKAAQDKGHVYIDVDDEQAQSNPSGTPSLAPPPANSTITGYATALGWDLSKLCALPYVFPPFTSIFVLIWETQNDLVRFHGYQSALASVVVLGVSFLLRVIFGWRTLAWILVRISVIASWYCGYIAHQSATALEREPFLPHVGPMSVSFVGEE